jgi:hypothetical protein
MTNIKKEQQQEPFMAGFDDILDEYAESTDSFTSALSTSDTDTTNTPKITEEILTRLENIEAVLTPNPPPSLDTLKQIEKLILPLLLKLIDPTTVDKKYIFWPGREDAIKKQIQKILTLTRPNQTGNQS